jgi:uncharacterized protein (TIGR02996 family)
VSDGYALLRAIEANPEEDTPRLAYADWLDEHASTDADRARAELIRVQCELARAQPGERKRELAAREYQLLNKYRKAWEAAHPIPLWGTHYYVRGFLFHTLDAPDFVKYGAALAAVAPLHFVGLRHVRDVAAAVGACPALQHVRYLSLESNRLGNKHLSALLDSPHLTNLHTFGLGNNLIGPAGCKALAAATSLPAMRVLALYGNFAVKDAGLKALTSAPWLANLVGLHVSGCGISSAVVIRLAGLPTTSRLLSLDVADRDRPDAAARAILDSPHLSGLVRLWYPDRDLSAPVRNELRARFGEKLNLTSYRLDLPTAGAA